MIRLSENGGPGPGTDTDTDTDTDTGLCWTWTTDLFFFEIETKFFRRRTDLQLGATNCSLSMLFSFLLVFKFIVAELAASTVPVNYKNIEYS